LIPLPVVSDVAGIGEIWEYRGLIKKMAITDLKVRYKNSVLGILWSLLQPLMIFIVLLIVFSGLFKGMSVTDYPYPLFLLLGIIGWGFFDKATGFSIGSVVGKPQLVKKIYFPREVLVISACLTALMMSLIEYVVFGAFMVAYGMIPTWMAILFPVVLLVEFFLALGVSLMISSLNVIWRDVQWIWPVVMQAGFFLTPIMYSRNIFDSMPYVGEVLKYNPMAAILDSLRYVLINKSAPLFYAQVLDYMGYAAIVAIVAVVAGWLVFNRLEPRFGEEV
jgi:lipopolysaccharide transport system permease protein